MDPSFQFCVFLALWSVLEFYKLILPVILGLFLMDCAWSFKILTQMGDFRCGFVVFGCSSSVGNLILLLFVAFGLGLRVLRFGGLRRCFCEFMGKSRVLRDGYCSKSVRNDEFVWRRKDSDCGDHCSDDFPATKEEEEDEEQCSEDESFSVPALRKMVKAERRRADEALNDLEKERMTAASAAEESMAMILRIQNEKSALQREEEDEEQCSEDESFSVPALRKMVKSERRRADAALSDLEKERMAAASAAEESMAMILRIQNEKSALQMEVKQMRRMSEDKQAYDQEVIQSLEWTVMQCEEERSALEQQLMFCRKRLQMYVEEEDDDDDELLLDCIDGASAKRLGFGDLQVGSKWQEQSRMSMNL